MNIIDVGLQFQSNHTTRSGAPKGIVLHHACGTGSVQDVHSWHLNNGWAGIGYHFYVRKNGNIYRGRPESWIGAHTVGANDMLGICAEGNFETERMGSAQQNAIVALLQYLYGKYGPLSVHKHKDFAATDCPGKNYPFSDIVNAEKSADDLVKQYQQACIADGIALPKYGADGIWGSETAGAANKLLTTGSKGSRVKLAQQLLMTAGCSLPKYGADGSFGDETNAAVRAYQSQKGLSVDGIIGPNTWKSLLGV